MCTTWLELMGVKFYEDSIRTDIIQNENDQEVLVRLPYTRVP
jgi:hypothetical protein